MEGQHAFDPDRRTPRAVGLGIDRLNDRHQVYPWDDAVHLIEELLTAGGLAILLECHLGKSLLLHGRTSRSVLAFS